MYIHQQEYMPNHKTEVPYGAKVEMEKKPSPLFNGIRPKKEGEIYAIEAINHALTNLVSDLAIALGNRKLVLISPFTNKRFNMDESRIRMLELNIACYLQGRNQAYYLNLINSLHVEQNSDFSILGPQLMKLREKDEACRLYSPEEIAMLDEMIGKTKVIHPLSDGFIDYLENALAVITRLAIVIEPIELARSLHDAVLQQQQIVGSEKR